MAGFGEPSGAPPPPTAEEAIEFDQPPKPPFPNELTIMALKMLSKRTTTTKFINSIIVGKEFYALGEEWIYTDILLRSVNAINFARRFPVAQLGNIKTLTLDLTGVSNHWSDAEKRRTANDFINLLPGMTMLHTVSIKRDQFRTGNVEEGWSGLQFIDRALRALPASVINLELDTTVAAWDRRRLRKLGQTPHYRGPHFCETVAEILPRLQRFSWTTYDVCAEAFGLFNDGTMARACPHLRSVHVDVSKTRWVINERCDASLNGATLPWGWRPTTLEVVSRDVVPLLRWVVAHHGRARLPALERCVFYRRANRMNGAKYPHAGWLQMVDVVEDSSVSIPYRFTYAEDEAATRKKVRKRKNPFFPDSPSPSPEPDPFENEAARALRKEREAAAKPPEEEPNEPASAIAMLCSGRLDEDSLGDAASIGSYPSEWTPPADTSREADGMRRFTPSTGVEMRRHDDTRARLAAPPGDGTTAAAIATSALRGFKHSTLPTPTGLGAWYRSVTGTRTPGVQGDYSYPDFAARFLETFQVRGELVTVPGAGAPPANIFPLAESGQARVDVLNARAYRWKGCLELDWHYGFMPPGWRAAPMPPAGGGAPTQKSKWVPPAELRLVRV